MFGLMGVGGIAARSLPFMGFGATHRGARVLLTWTMHLDPTAAAVVKIMRGCGAEGPTMADTDAKQFRKEAEECRLLAEKATSPLDRDEWLRLAAEWTKLAQEAESRGGRWFRT
jgi:hypothetical protein